MKMGWLVTAGMALVVVGGAAGEAGADDMWALWSQVNATANANGLTTRTLPHTSGTLYPSQSDCVDIRDGLWRFYEGQSGVHIIRMTGEQISWSSPAPAPNASTVTSTIIIKCWPAGVNP
jgi:hypothetical protein